MTTTERSPYISSRPSWAERSEFRDHSARAAAIFHTWTVPTAGAGCLGSDGEVTPLTVELIRVDDLLLHESGVVVEEGPVQIFLPDLDASFSDTEQARRFAAAIVEACDRIDGQR